MTDRRKVALIILDGWGIGAGDASDAIAKARTPFMHELMARYPNSSLLTDGEHVGLPHGQMGNSEVGHLNIGAGRVVYQDLVRVDRAVADGTLEDNPVLQAAFEASREPGRRLHFLGLVSDGGVHSHQEHLVALCRMAQRAGVSEAFIHAFTDGRDTDPHSARDFLEHVQRSIAGTGVRVASIIGRYFAMDRDKRWERVRKAYDLLVHGKGTPFTNADEAIEANYDAGVTDEFIEPAVIVDGTGTAIGTIRGGDVVICFNFRTDRCREITQALTQQPFPDQDMVPLPLHYVTMTEYDHRYKGVEVLFRKDDLPMTLAEVVSKAGLKQLHIAETEKYPHVTFFFNGGREEPFPGEERIMVPSPKVPTYDLQPEMSAPEVTRAVVEALDKGEMDLVVVNFANPDMVGHTGVFSAIVKAVEVSDDCLRQVVEAGTAKGYSFVIIADHGNADKALNTDGSPNTAHTTNPVPVVLVDPRPLALGNGVLADVAPTLLALMGLEQPREMTGEVLLRS